MSQPRCPSCDHPVGVGDGYCAVCGHALALPPRDRTQHAEGPVAVASDVGRRRARNEDAYAVATAADRAAVVVCDGVSSTPHADRAAALASRAAGRVLAAGIGRSAALGDDGARALLADAVAAAQEAVAPLAWLDASGEAPSTTLVAAVLHDEGITVATVGDSRAYWVPADGSEGVVTQDDAETEVSLAVGAGAGDPLPLHRRLTRWIGGDAVGDPPRTTSVHAPGPGTLVLCSDGLWQYFDAPGQLAAEVRAAAAVGPVTLARQLLDAALAAGGGDNVTVAVLRVDPAPLARTGRGEARS